MTILREITNDKHREVEALPLIQSLIKGEMTEQMYLSYLYELHFIYGVLELCAKKAGVLDGLDGIERTHLIQKDIDELNPSYHCDMTNATIKYCMYLMSLLDSDKKNLLMAHVYTRHMGDLYGGKMIARVIPGSGLAYKFDDRPATIKAFNEKLSIELGDEALVAFDHFIDIFKELWEVIEK